MQYIVAAGASNNAVGLETLILSQVTEKTNLEVEWLASYTQEKGEKIGPTLGLDGKTTPSGELALLSNSYDKSAEKLNSWYGSLTYGVKSEEGFMGLTWSPDPLTTYEIKPKVNFYVALGSFSSNTLADINAISTNSANVTEDKFDGNYEATVYLRKDGKWDVIPGPPSTTSLGASMLLLNAHLNLSKAHADLTGLLAGNTNALDSGGEEELRKSTGVDINTKKSKKGQADLAAGYITGTVTIAAAIGFGFAYMIASGITLSISSVTGVGTAINFSYNGTASQQAVLAAFEAGKSIIFRT